METSKACVGEFSENREERLEQIIVVAGRCSDYELLTVNAVVEGQSETWRWRSRERLGLTMVEHGREYGIQPQKRVIVLGNWGN